MMKKLILMSTILGLAFQVQATTYYNTGTPWPDSGGSWNTQADGLGSAGFSGTYTSADNDLIVRFISESGDSGLEQMGMSDNGLRLAWGANSLTLHTNINFEIRSVAPTAWGADFDNVDIYIEGTNVNITSGVAAACTNDANISGTGRIHVVAGRALTFRHAFSSVLGRVEFNLEFFGDGEINFDFSKAGLTWYMGGVSTNFTGQWDMAKMGGIVQLPAGDGLILADVTLADDSGRTGQIDMNADFAFGTFSIEGVVIPNGSYTKAELVSYCIGFGAAVGDNLIDNGGKIFVGQSSLPVSTYADWTVDWNLLVDNALGDNPDGDTLDNQSEYAMGGNPTNAVDAAGVVPTFQVVDVAGTNYFEYVYNRRTDAVARSLTYDVINTDNLNGVWGYDAVEVGVSTPFLDAQGDEFESVTNHISMVGVTEEFQNLEIIINE